MNKKDSNKSKAGKKNLEKEQIGDKLLQDYPGRYPFKRGIHKDMYRKQLWTMRQYSGFSSAEETNQRFKELLTSGAQGLSVAFDLPTQMGLDSDHKLSLGEIGRTGVAISTQEDFAKLFEGIDLSKISVSMTINATAFILLAFLIVTAENQGVDIKELRGTIQNDILKEHLARGTYIFEPDFGLRLTTETVAYASYNLPKFNAISISGYHIREAGSSVVQELAFTFSNAIQYCEKLKLLGLKPSEFVRNLSFFFNGQIEFLVEIAKFRAARVIWSKILRERFDLKDDELCKLRFHTQTAGSSLTAQQALNNLTRSTIEALAAVLGGTQSLHTNAYDEALGLPSEESAISALRIQQIIAYESGVADVVDPFGGSYWIESKTDSITNEVFETIGQIDQMGGMLSAIKNSWPQSQIEESAYRFQRELELGEKIQVGVNKFQEGENLKIPVFKPDVLAEKKQLASLAKYKQDRDQKKVHSSQIELLDSLKKGENIMLGVINCVRAKCTLGEIIEVLRKDQEY